MTTDHRQHTRICEYPPYMLVISSCLPSFLYSCLPSAHTNCFERHTLTHTHIHANTALS